MSYLSYGGMLRHETDTAIVQTLLGKGWEFAPMPTIDDGQRADWVDGQWVVSAIVVPVPQEVPRWALREVCMNRGHEEEIAAAIESLPEPPRKKAKLRWNEKSTISRGSDMISAMQQILGWTSDYVDELFREAFALDQQ